MVRRARVLRRGSLPPACLVALLIVISAPSLRGQVVINEILASNRFTNVDEDGDSSDWIELHNPGLTTVDITGYSLSDNRGDLRQWLFPETSLGSRDVHPERPPPPNSRHMRRR